MIPPIVDQPPYIADILHEKGGIYVFLTVIVEYITFGRNL